MDLRVAHCNPRTGYNLIAHVFNPGTCTECLMITLLFDGDIEQTKIEIDKHNTESVRTYGPHH